MGMVGTRCEGYINNVKQEECPINPPSGQLHIAQKKEMGGVDQEAQNQSRRNQEKKKVGYRSINTWRSECPSRRGSKRNKKKQKKKWRHGAPGQEQVGALREWTERQTELLGVVRRRENLGNGPRSSVQYPHCLAEDTHRGFRCACCGAPGHPG